MKPSNSDASVFEGFLLMMGTHAGGYALSRHCESYVAALWIASLLSQGRGWLGVKLLLDERGDEARHRRGEVGPRPHQMDRREFGLGLPGEIGLDPVSHRLARNAGMQDPDHGNRGDGHHAVPMGGGLIIRWCQSGFLFN